MADCPWKKCDKPWHKHGGLERIIHSEKAEDEKGCTCPVIRVGDYCPIHGG